MSAQLSVHRPTEAETGDLSRTSVTLDIFQEGQPDDPAIILFISKNDEGLAFARKLVVAATNAVALILESQ